MECEGEDGRERDYVVRSKDWGWLEERPSRERGWGSRWDHWEIETCEPS